MGSLRNGSENQYLLDYRHGKIKKGLGIGCNLDHHLVFKRKQFNCVLGADNVGKTYFILWYFLALATNHNLKFGVYCAENEKGQILIDLIQMYTKSDYMLLTDNEIQMASYEIENWFIFIDSEERYTPKQLLDEFKKIDCDAYLIDPLNQLEYDLGYSENIRVVRSFKHWCKINNKTIYLSLHPVTSAGRSLGTYPKGHEWEGHIMMPGKSMAEGGKVFSNMADDWINVNRLTKHPTMYFFTQIDVDKVKNKMTGGKPTMFEQPIMCNFNFGRGMTIGGVDPIKRKETKQTLKPNDVFDINHTIEPATKSATEDFLGRTPDDLPF